MEKSAMYKKILVPVDGSESSTRGLEEAIKIAKQCGATLRLAHAVNEQFVDIGVGAAAYASQFIAAMREAGAALLRDTVAKVQAEGLMPESVLLDQLGTRVADLIVDHANRWQADLIVMGTHGRRGVSRLVMGSDAELVLRSSWVPVLLVPIRKPKIVESRHAERR
jgi:nucleotide-binding universal stress UspA family protein